MKEYYINKVLGQYPRHWSWEMNAIHSIRVTTASRHLRFIKPKSCSCKIFIQLLQTYNSTNSNKSSLAITRIKASSTPQTQIKLPLSKTASFPLRNQNLQAFAVDYRITCDLLCLLKCAVAANLCSHFKRCSTQHTPLSTCYAAIVALVFHIQYKSHHPIQTLSLAR